MRRGALLNDAQNIGMSPILVAGGENAVGNCDAMAGFCGPMSVTLAGLPVVLMAPWGGSSGLPNVAAFAATAAVATVPAAAAAASTLRRDTGSIESPPRMIGLDDRTMAQKNLPKRLNRTFQKNNGMTKGKIPNRQRQDT